MFDTGATLLPDESVGFLTRVKFSSMSLTLASPVSFRSLLFG